MAESPTVARRRLRIELHRLRTAKGMTGSQVAEALGWSAAKVTRAERGSGYMQPTDVDALCRLYDAPADLREVLVLLARQSKKRGWWQAGEFRRAIPEWFHVYIGLESTASGLRKYDSEYVPGLFQLEEYMYEVFRAQPERMTPEKIDRLIEARLNRQKILTTEHSPDVWVILNQAVLCRAVGGARLMARQLRSVAELAVDAPGITVQVLPWSAGAHAGMLGAFTILTFPEPGDTDVVFLDHLTGASYAEEDDQVRHYDMAFRRLMATAASESESAALIHAAIKEYER
ncbi:helix-turn-helix domain-containing protein [Allostreptomyces psammosilenae]|uniref:Transcriptional regulator with XRE-family HTH domain n=1 Tax=Allostreptomyces psammosilenae TaxID=1892865 RepID=A0A853AAT0_9ACTN|nr:helix-turn-helix transcriptional regulator [Allostreptomyces psammosilenae]NYI07731.1 transcriptional regulator with XRE-family HTH domain [Allostreptomyces psammosilenae]